MSDVVNPYQSPQAEAKPVGADLAPAGALTELMIRYLKEASPWLRFIGILGFIGCGIMALVGVVFMVLLPLFTSFFNYTYFSGLGNFGGLIGGAFGLIYIVIAAVFFFPSRFIYLFGTKIRTWLRSNAEHDLEASFRNNKSFWKFIGIVSIVNLAFIPVSVVIGIIAAVAVAFQ